MWTDDEAGDEGGLDLVEMLTRTRSAGPMLEIATLWGDAWLDHRAYAPGQAVALEGLGSVRWDGLRAFVDGPEGELEVRDEPRVVEAGGLVFVVRRATPGRAVRNPWPVDRASVACGVATAAAGCLAATGMRMAPEPQRNHVVELDERFVELLMISQPPPRSEHPPAAEGARAKRDEGRVGKKDARMDKAKGERVPVQKQEIDRRVVEQAGVMGALSDESLSRSLAGSPGLNDGIGGLIGARGAQIGSAGLGSKGTGLGGGGTAEGLGGFGARDMGTGAGFGTGAMWTPLSHDPISRDNYEDYGTNEMVLVANDPLSTFAIDVDTGSFTNARRSIEEGWLPPPASVRVEEFVNYPDYDYDAPTGDSPLGVTLEAAPSPWASGRHVLRVGLHAPEPAGARKPVHLVFLVDVSGSMNTPDRLPLAKECLASLVGGLGPEDTVGLVTYAGGVRAVLEPTPTTRKAEILDAIDQLRSGGGTAMGSGMTLAYEMASDAFVEGIENRVIVLSDGDTNIGATSHDQILAGIEEYAKKGITLSTIGFGRGNYNDALMEQLADRGDGNYFYVDSLEEGERIFGEKLTSTIQTVATDVKVQVEFDARAVHAYRLIGYENRDVADEDFRDDAVDAGEVGAGHRVTALYELILKDAPSGDLATVRIRAEKPGAENAAGEWTTPLPVSRVEDELADTTRDFRVALGMATFAEVLRGSAPEVELTDVAALIRGAARHGSDDSSLATLVDTAAALRQEQPEAGLAELDQVQPGDPIILGALDRHLVDTVVRRHGNQLRYCYQRELTKRADLAGKVTMKFVIAKDGTVSSATTKSSTLSSDPVESCLEGRFMKMQFPQPKGGGIVIVSYPFAFSPA
jgi:Ca-activated chloride channel family protein